MLYSCFHLCRTEKKSLILIQNTAPSRTNRFTPLQEGDSQIDRPTIHLTMLITATVAAISTASLIHTIHIVER